MKGASMAQQTLIQPSQVAQRIMDLAKNPQVEFPLLDEDEERSEVEPDNQEWPIENQGVRLEPLSGTLRSSLETIKDKVIWAIDGGALTIEIPVGVLLIGRAVVIRLSFRGYETARRELLVPALPMMVCSGPAVTSMPEASSLYLNQALQIIPAELKQRRKPLLDFFSDGQSYLDKFADMWVGATSSQLMLARAIDIVRNAAEMIAFQTALRLAQPTDLVLKDGRVHGSFGFWTLLSPSKSIGTEGEKALDTFIKDTEDALRRDVRVAGIVKRVASGECAKWLRANGLSDIRYTNDAMLYLRACDNLKPPELGFGKRSTLWRYKPFISEDETQISPRSKLERFRRDTAFFYLVPGQTVPPFRVDIPTSYGKYLTWYEDLASQVYTLARGSGSPSRIPHPIVIADSWARVPRAEAVRFLYALITELEQTGDPEARSLAREIKAWTLRGK
jgi:hypothetical protein